MIYFCMASAGAQVRSKIQHRRSIHLLGVEDPRWTVNYRYPKFSSKMMERNVVYT